MPRKCRDYFTVAEIARAFDVPADKIETVAGKKFTLIKLAMFAKQFWAFIQNGLAMALQLMNAIV